MKGELWNLAQTTEKHRLMLQIGKLPPGLYEVFIKPRKQTRTLDQNAYYWVAVVAPFTEWLREHYGDPRISSEQAHEMLKVKILGWDLKDVKGETLTLIPRSRTLDTKEFGQFIDDAAKWLAEFCDIIVIPSEVFYDGKS